MNDQRSSHNHGHLGQQRMRTPLAAPETVSPTVLEAQPWSASCECLFQQMLDGCVLISENGHVLDANPAYCEMVRYSRDQLRKMRVSDLEALHSPDEIAETIALFMGGIPRHFKTQHRRSDGSLIDLEPLPQVVIRDVHGGHAILCMFRDITEKKRLEEALERREERFSKAFFANPTASVIADTKGLIKHANDTSLRLLGFDRHSDIVGRALQDFSPDTDIAKLVETAQGRTGEATVRRDDGATFDAQFSVSVITNQSGDVAAIMSSFLDITRQKQAERALLRAEKQRAQAERYVAAGRIAAEVAHEINNPLSGIANCFQLVKQAVPESHRHHRLAEVIEREIDRIGRIVRQMFELSRPGRRANPAVHVQEALEDVVVMLTPIAKQREVHIEPHADASLTGKVISCDGLRQVVYNLLNNAIEMLPSGGTVKLTACVVSGKLWITVADNGPGIRPDLHSRIFEPFFTTKENTDSGGLGLGLPICKAIVESAGGVIEFCSADGKGSTFCVILPIGASGSCPIRSRTRCKDF